MATKHFLTEIQLEEAGQILRPPAKLPDGSESINLRFHSGGLSDYLGKRVSGIFSAFSQWEKAGPIVLGSWARGDLCPKSDIDMLFCGDEEVTKKIVDDLAHQGIKIRYRMPEDPNDWTVGVLPFDILALFDAKGLTADAEEKLVLQRRKIHQDLKVHRGNILKEIKKEREARSIRYDSIANFLEPNIKYGAGGLRDLQQGRIILQLFPEKFKSNGRAELVLNYYHDFFLTIRQKLHLLGGQDILLAHFQEEISKWFGYKNKTDFMGQVELGLSRVSFYSDWMIALASGKRPEREFETSDEALKVLAKQSDVLMQFEVRQKLDDLQKLSASGYKKYFQIKMGEEFFDSLFRSRIIDRIIPNLYPVFGLVQHDQYHRYSVDAHTLQCLRNVCRIYKNKKYLLGMKEIFSSLRKEDWEILLWSCIYHDIGKGSGKPHEIYGAEVTESDFKKFGLGKNLSEEVSWIVRNHLVLSQFAFRQNLRSPLVWQKLSDKGVGGQRLLRLAAFTALDIYSTNSEAWNPWKATLINDVVKVMEGKQTKVYLDFLKRAKKKKVNLLPEFLTGIDPMVVEGIGPEKLLADYQNILKTKTDLEPLVIKANRIWVRFHRKADRPGIFFELVEKLFNSGFNIHHAFVQTFVGLGVYDWFEVKTSMEAGRIKKILDQEIPSKTLPKVKFSNIEIVSSDEKETVVSFRGLDQSGVLVNAAKALTDAGLTINWARVLTWGRQFDDVFGVTDPQKRSNEELLSSLKNISG